MPSTTTQRKLASQFIAVTNATKENAAQFLKNANYNLDTAVNLYYNSIEPLDLGFGRSADQNLEKELGKLFDSLRNEVADTKTEEVADTKTEEVNSKPKIIGVKEITAYTEALGVNMLNYEMFVLYDVVRPEAFGQFSRDEFIKGWKSLVAVKPTVEAQKKYIRARIAEFPRDSEDFKTVYRVTFLASREPQEKDVEKDMALACWDELFSPTLHPWKTDKVDFLDAWKRFLEGNWDSDVNKDMWNQTLDFANRTMEDDTLGFWSEDSAWSGVIDDFVLWCRETGVVPEARTGTNGMEVDE